GSISSPRKGLFLEQVDQIPRGERALPVAARHAPDRGHLDGQGDGLWLLFIVLERYLGLEHERIAPIHHAAGIALDGIEVTPALERPRAALELARAGEQVPDRGVGAVAHGL